jgi:EAL domain-containing protein (putative c-di-GMP-specific phosphodiesterase class I)
VVYSPKLDSGSQDSLSLLGELRQALEQGQLRLYFQPKVNLLTGEVIGAEALVRWQHPDGTLRMPDAFIPVAEESRLIVPLGEWVLKTACARLREWHLAGFPQLRMCVNLSARQFQQPNIATVIRSAIDEAGLPPACLELEITESIAMQNVEWTAEVLRALRHTGVHIAIDDFGTGQSSLSYLKHFPLSTLKIDRTFVRDIAVDPEDEAIVNAVIALAHVLGLRVIAEGVETEQQLSFLRRAGCEEYQGYLFSRPLPPDQLTALLETRRAARA